VGFIICYLLPAVFYLKIRSHKEINARKVKIDSRTPPLASLLGMGIG
ncbi:unnamed protein product, partial [Choristocarpus tenellus]